jgi:PIN domain nuclease of toxin-antitoxin system
VVLDASALLAFLHDEPGADRVQQAFDGSLVSSVNWSEVIQKALLQRADISGMQQEFSEVGVIFHPFTLQQAETAAQLWQQTRRHGLSLGDRACLALAIEQQSPVLTADRAWGRLDLDIEVRLLR